MPRIDPDKKVKHGHHTDYYWPGHVHSVWTKGDKFEIRRERQYTDSKNQNLKSTAWYIRLGRLDLGGRLR